MRLTEQEMAEMKRLKAYFPYRIISAVKTPDGKCEFFANHTKAKANNYVRKYGGILFRLA